MAKITTLCYLRRGDSYLMLLRNKKEKDANRDKWIGTGGKLQAGETPAECVVREVREETGYTLTRFVFRGIITFLSDIYEDEYMILYEGKDWTGEQLPDCDEGELRWIPFSEVMNLPLWEGDRVFLPLLMETEEEIFLKLTYRGDTLTEAKREMAWPEDPAPAMKH